MRKLKTVLVTLSMLLLPTGSALAQSKPPTVVRHGIQIGALGALRTSLPEIAAKHGVSYEIKDFGDSSAALRALDQGEIDIANTTSQHLVRAINEGMDVVWVAGWGGGYNLLVARKEIGASAANPAALKALVEQRKRTSPVSIAVPTGSLQHAKLISYLKLAGIDADRDVRIVNIGFPNHPRALEAGEVDLAMTLAGFGTLAMEKSGAVLVQQLYDGPFGKQEIGFIVRRKLIESNPDLVQRMVSSHLEAMRLFVGNMEKQVEYEKKYSRFPPSVIETTERRFLRYDWRTNVADIKAMASDMHALGWARENVSNRVEKALDLSFLTKASGQSANALSSW
jgi:ABC-type nitrate/sulfonate/bicarbonate transport system substrate-binding protein